MVAASPSPSAMRAAAWSTSSATPSTDRRPRLSTGTGRCGCKTFLAEWALCGAVVVEPRTGYVEQPPIRSVTLLPPAERKSATQNEVERPVRDWCRDEAGQREPYISRQRQLSERPTRDRRARPRSAAPRPAHRRAAPRPLPHPHGLAIHYAPALGGGHPEREARSLSLAMSRGTARGSRTVASAVAARLLTSGSSPSSLRKCHQNLSLLSMASGPHELG